MSVHGALTLERASEGCGSPPRALFGQEREGPPRVLRVLADRAPYRNPNGPGKASQVRSALPGATSHPAFTRRGGAARYLTSRLFRQTLWSASRESGQELVVPGRAARGGRVFCRGS